MSMDVRKTSPEALNPEKIEEMGMAYLVHIRKEFPFAQINHYQHLVTAHSREIFENETVFSPGDLSAQAQEKKNKNLHTFRAQFSSTVSLKKNLEHAFLRDWLYSSPTLANLAMSEKKCKPYACSFCHELGHNKRRCPNAVPEEEAMEDHS